MQICRLQKGDINKAMYLVKEVFDQYDAPDYPDMGIKTFYHFIQTDNIEQMLANHQMQLYGAYVNRELAGVIAIREVMHISLLFVKEDYQRQGIAKALVNLVKKKYQGGRPDKKYITVNASPYAVDVYRKLGFLPLSQEEERDGIRFTSMAFHL